MSFLTLSTSKDLLDKCMFELSILEGCESNPHFEYHAFNLIISLNHLFEWFYKESNQERRLDCARLFNPYDSERKPELYKSISSQIVWPLEVNQYQMTIRKLCNNAKHFKKKETVNPQANIIATMGGIYMGGANSFMGAASHYTYLVEVNGVEIDILILLRSQIKAWFDFFGNYV